METKDLEGNVLRLTSSILKIVKLINNNIDDTDITRTLNNGFCGTHYNDNYEIDYTYVAVPKVGEDDDLDRIFALKKYREALIIKYYQTGNIEVIKENRNHIFNSEITYDEIGTMLRSDKFNKIDNRVDQDITKFIINEDERLYLIHKYKTIYIRWSPKEREIKETDLDGLVINIYDDDFIRNNTLKEDLNSLRSKVIDDTIEYMDSIHTSTEKNLLKKSL